jgi:hypothetical protein
MAAVTQKLAREAITALAPPARAFARAQKLGYVWLGEQGTFETVDGTLCHDPKPPANPDQLRLV